MSFFNKLCFFKLLISFAADVELMQANVKRVSNKASHHYFFGQKHFACRFHSQEFYDLSLIKMISLLYKLMKTRIIYCSNDNQEADKNEMLTNSTI